MWKPIVVSLAILVGGCASAQQYRQHKLTGVALQKNCAAHGQRVFEKFRAMGPPIGGVITLVAAIADPLWQAKAQRDKAYADCMENGGV